ncbi:MAG: transcription termination/antitermination protein NusA [Chloroflexi bacterium]|nr:transcription termination/antitermination protein NusA [Chloroflexota bacterium]
MKSDFLLAITQLSAEKNLSTEVVLSAVEAALVSAYRKDNFAPHQNITVKINSTTGKVQVWAEKAVVERPSDNRCEISLAEARRLKPEAQIGDTVVVEATPSNAGRIAAQTAKQVILQRLHEAEHSAIFEEYAGKEGEIVTGVVQRIEPKQILVDLGRTEAVLPSAGQVHNERYRAGQRLKAVILEVARTNRGPRVMLSRTHPDLVRRLFEIEVPEIFSGVVEVKAIAREAGSRSKVAVVAHQEGVDPVGCCVGLRGIRIQNIVNELNGEKIDVVAWSPDTGTFIMNALSPAQIVSTGLNEAEKVATVIVPDRQLSLAIGKEGQNVRLAAKLTGWRIDIKSLSAAELEKAKAPKPLAGVAAAKPKLVAVAVTSGEAVEAVPVLEPALAAGEAGKAAPPPDITTLPPVPLAIPFEVTVTAEKPKLRFAEDFSGHGVAKAQPAKQKKKKKPSREKEGEEEGVGAKKGRRGKEIVVDEEEEY